MLPLPGIKHETHFPCQFDGPLNFSALLVRPQAAKPPKAAAKWGSNSLCRVHAGTRKDRLGLVAAATLHERAWIGLDARPLSAGVGTKIDVK
jgi:hypothetical protein